MMVQCGSWCSCALLLVACCKILQIEGLDLDNDKDVKSHDSDKRVLSG